MRQKLPEPVHLPWQVAGPKCEVGIGAIRHDDSIRLGNIHGADPEALLRDHGERLDQGHSGFKTVPLESLSRCHRRGSYACQNREVKELVGKSARLHEHPLAVAQETLARNEGLRDL